MSYRSMSAFICFVTLPFPFLFFFFFFEFFATTAATCPAKISMSLKVWFRISWKKGRKKSIICFPLMHLNILNEMKTKVHQFVVCTFSVRWRTLTTFLSSSVYGRVGGMMSSSVLKNCGNGASCLGLESSCSSGTTISYSGMSSSFTCTIRKRLKGLFWFWFHHCESVQQSLTVVRSSPLGFCMNWRLLLFKLRSYGSITVVFHSFIWRYKSCISALKEGKISKSWSMSHALGNFTAGSHLMHGCSVLRDIARERSLWT